MKDISATNSLLLFITNLGPGGAQRVFHNHAMFLSERYAVQEAVFDKAEFQNLYSAGKPVLSLDVTAGAGFYGKLSHFLKRCRNLKRLVSDNQITLCISHMDGANWVNVLSRSGAKKILVVHGTVRHDDAVSKKIQWLRTKILIPYLYNKAAVTVAVSEGIRHELETFYKVKNVVAIPNFFDVPAIQEKAKVPLPEQENRLFANFKIIITSGRFHEQKKQRYLFPLFKQVTQAVPDAKLVLLGDGELRNDLIAQAEAAGLTCYTVWGAENVFSDAFDVYFLGYKENPFQYLSRSALFVFPSGWEGFPLALCEAMISGVPVLSADCPTGPREILAPGTFDAAYGLTGTEQTPYGYLLPMTDKPSFMQEWFQAITALLKNDKKRAALVTNSLERMQAYNKPVIVQKWYDLIDCVLEKQ